MGMVGGLAGMGIACGEAEDMLDVVVVGGLEWDAEFVRVRLEVEESVELVTDAGRRRESWKKKPLWL